MRKLIWKIRYAMHMRKQADTSWRFAWAAAEAGLESHPDALDDCPIYACDEELSCWGE